MLISLILLILLLAAVVKKSYAIERDIVIDQPAEKIFDYVKLLKNQEKYNVWVMRDPNVKIAYTGIDGTVGFISRWHGNKQAGKGEQEIIEVVKNRYLKMELRFEEPFKNVGQTYLYTQAISAHQTKVTWIMTGENKFPMSLINLFIDGLLGKDLQKSLLNLKQLF